MPVHALACSVCFGNPDSSLTIGLQIGMITLLGFVAMIFVLVISFAVNMNLRMKQQKID